MKIKHYNCWVVSFANKANVSYFLLRLWFLFEKIEFNWKK